MDRDPSKDPIVTRPADNGSLEACLTWGYEAFL